MFRIEAVHAQRQSLQGYVHLAPPLSWQIIGYGLLVALVTAVVFLALGGVDKFEPVSGGGDMDHAEEAFGELASVHYWDTDGGGIQSPSAAHLVRPR